MNEGSLLCCVRCDDRASIYGQLLPQLELYTHRYTTYFMLHTTESQAHRLIHKHTYIYEKTRVQKNIKLRCAKFEMLYKDIECKLPRDSFRIVKYAIMLGARMCSLNTHCTRMHLAQESLSTLSFSQCYHSTLGDSRAGFDE